ncbi:hypothetical protein [Marinibactrum halimedae]|uniref:DUF5723 domain-containing protein n=1 Tax=Marinibactrum halimedae TaxID=1444977 RepID=A0AA37T7D0_9GAMM|nr:hypothetical protein [Marinibactrum halimedae]MCD9460132.1 hypothetical protein [Marinibactrum halimedae]GLS26398.1 hypothetical protein GCM10007877_21130 [Marinibactrum halimedae]
MRINKVFSGCVVLLAISKVVISTHVYAADLFSSSDYSVYVNVHSVSYSEPAPIKQMIDSLEGDPIEHGEFAFSHNQIELGGSIGAWKIGVFKRIDYFLEFTSDTAEVVYLNENDLSLESGKVYQINLEPNTLESTGLGVEYDWSFPESWTFTQQLNLQTRINYFRAEEIHHGRLWGQLSADPETDFSGDLFLDYDYTEDSLLDRPPEEGDGQGVGVDVQMIWKPNEQWQLQFIGKDIWTYIRWSELTYTEASATSNRIQFDDQGRISSIPLLSGREWYRDVVQRLPHQISTSMTYQVNPNWGLKGTSFFYDKYHFPIMALQYKTDIGSLELEYNTKAEAIGIGFHSPIFFLRIAMDDHWEAAKSATLSTGLTLSF